MDLQIEINDIRLNIDKQKIHKMIFLFNALENGWSIKKKNKEYIFSKNHEGKREVYNEDYLENFIKNNSNINKFFS